jgi:hypothetical protein
MSDVVYQGYLEEGHYDDVLNAYMKGVSFLINFIPAFCE